MILALLLAAIGLLIAYLYVKFQISYRFWQQRNVPSLPPKFPLGNMQDSIFEKKHFAFISQDFYKKLQPHGSDYAGIYLFNKPSLIVMTPEFAKTVLVRDFQYFVDRGVYYNKKNDPLSANLFFIEGDEWRNLRAKVSPTFTSGKMKTMFHMILHVGDELISHMNSIISTDADGAINVREYLARFTTDVIGTCAFGLDCNSIVNPKSEFREMGKKMFNFTKIQSLKLFLSMLMKEQARALGVQFNTDEVIDFVMQLVQKTIRHRKDNNVHRNDFMQLMIDLHKENDADENVDGLTIEEIAAQSFVFFFAGFETSSTTMTYALYELALNQTIQEQLRSEVSAGGVNKFSYEEIMGMNYLDQVVSGKFDILHSYTLRGKIC